MLGPHLRNHSKTGRFVPNDDEPTRGRQAVWPCQEQLVRSVIRLAHYLAKRL